MWSESCRWSVRKGAVILKKQHQETYLFIKWGESTIEMLGGSTASAISRHTDDLFIGTRVTNILVTNCLDGLAIVVTLDQLGTFWQRSLHPNPKKRNDANITRTR